jgi:hypothetical protein
MARRRGYVLPGAIALAALLGIGAALGAGDLAHPADRTISGPDIALPIALDIQGREGTRSIPAVSCPAREPVRAGLRFTCRAGARTVYVTEVDGRGRVTWSFTP